MKTADFDYHLPPESIAQIPVEPRHNSRLMAVDRQTGQIQHYIFHQIGEFLRPGDLLVLNETRVIPARLYGKKIPTGGKVEVLLLKRHDAYTWEALAGGKSVGTGKQIQIVDGPSAEVLQVLDGSRRLLRFSEPVENFQLAGHMPLPPYIHAPLQDPERYQTVYARQAGSAAAPTAGLHFTEQLLQALQNQGISTTTVTLHVGLDTFLPVHEDDPRQHEIHSEWCQLSAAAAEKINAAKAAGGRIIAVGTTSVRTLESAAQQAGEGEVVRPFEGPTSLYILPGYEYRAVDAMITNFHLPKSTLLMLVSALAGRETIFKAYETAIQAGYRFYSFGDAMFIY